MLTVGDKLMVTKDVPYLNKGDIVEVTNVDEEVGVFSFTVLLNEENVKCTGTISISLCEKYFEKIVEKTAPSITSEYIKEIIANSDIESYTVFDKCTVVTCRLPNGFVIVESSACVSPENYDEEMGKNICMSKIEDKIWELEGYRLQSELYEEAECCGSCEGCPCDCCEEEYDECLDTDLDCDDCDDFDCPYNTNKNK